MTFLEATEGSQNAEINWKPIEEIIQKEDPYVVKVEPIESKSILKIKLKNSEIWMCDYDEHMS